MPSSDLSKSGESLNHHFSFLPVVFSLSMPTLPPVNGYSVILETLSQSSATPWQIALFLILVSLLFRFAMSFFVPKIGKIG
jgi:hypothetical protein